MKERLQNKSMEAPKKKGKYILLILMLLLLAVIVAVVAYCYPKWKTAQDFEKYIDFNSFSYEMDVELFKDELEREQIELLNRLSRLADIDEDSMYRLYISGDVYENVIYAQIYPEGMSEPLLELYLSNGRDVVNGEYLYSCIRSELVGDSRLLNGVLPSGDNGVYLTLEQAEQLFDMDLSDVRRFNPSFNRYDLSVLEYFAILAALPFIRQAEDSGLALSEYNTVPEVPVSGREHAVVAHLSVQEPSLMIEQNADILEKLGFSFDSAKVKAIKSLVVDISSDNAHEIVMPESGVSQEIVDVLSGIRKLVGK